MADEVIKIKAILEDKISSQLGIIKAGIAAAFGAFSIHTIANWAVKFQAIIDKITIYQDKIAKLSKATGIATETLSSLGYAADIAGGNIDAVAMGLRNLMRNANAANDGVKASKKVFEDLGIQILDTNGRLKDGNELLLDVADAFVKETNATEKAAIAQRLFGRSGMELIPLLNEGRKGIEQLQEKAKKLGIVLSGEAAASAEQYRDNITDLNTALDGLETSIVIAVVPALSNMIKTMSDGLVTLRDFTGSLDKFATFKVGDKNFRLFQIFKDALENMSRGKSVFDAFKYATIEAATGVDLLADNLKKLDSAKPGDDDKTPPPPEDESKKDKQELKSLADHLNEKVRLYQEEYAERKQIFDELNANVKDAQQKTYDDELQKIIERNDAIQAGADKEIEIQKEKAKELREIEQQKARDYQEAFAIMMDNLRAWGEESQTAFELYKAYASAETMISAFKSAQKIFEAVAGQVWLGPLALPAAAAASGIAMAAGMARAAAIASQDYKGKAIGGDVAANQPYIVGERGREMFVPNMDGYIIPNNVLKKLGGKSTVININAIDAQSFKSFLRNGGASVLESEMSKGRLF